jgi:hypothetical protein
MAETFAPLPWEDLRRMEGDLPWPALETFAEAVVGNPDLAQELFAEYDRAWQAVDVLTYIDLYVPAIFALAAPRLGEEQRREIGDFLIDKLMEAGQEDAELTEDALLAACGSMGPVILPKVLDTLEAMPDTSGAWSRCWNLTAVAAGTEDTAVRSRTAQACIRLLEQIERDTIEEFLGISAAWTLALLKCAEAVPLLQRLSKSCSWLNSGADYQEAMEFLQGHPDRTAYEEAWERPVRKWLEPSWRTARKWLASPNSEGSNEEDEEREETASWKRACELTDRFAASPGAADLPENLREDAPCIAHTLLEYAHVHEGAAPEEFTQQTLRAILLDMFPRKISAERDYFEKVPPVVETFLRWLAAEGILPDGESLAQTVRSWSDEIVAAAMDPENWGPAKNVTMQALRAGVDTTDQDAMRKYLYEQTQKALEERAYDSAYETPVTPPIPIVEHSLKIGRNNPCPCGSGRKYKKCCGDPTKGQAATPLHEQEESP